MLNAAALEDMQAAGIPAEQILEVAISMLKRAEEEEAQRLAVKREAARQRKAKSRKNNDPVTNVTVTERDACDKKETSPTPPKEKTKNPPKGGQKETSDDFEEVWGAWPAMGRRRSSIPKARAAYLKARKRCSHAEVMRAVALFAQSSEPGDGGKMTPGLHRWLNDRKHESWLEDVPQAPAFDWAGEIKLFQDWGDWRPDGPPPGDPGCKAPAEVQREFGYEPQPRRAQA